MLSNVFQNLFLKFKEINWKDLYCGAVKPARQAPDVQTTKPDETKFILINLVKNCQIPRLALNIFGVHLKELQIRKENLQWQPCEKEHSHKDCSLLEKSFLQKLHLLYQNSTRFYFSLLCLIYFFGIDWKEDMNLKTTHKMFTKHQHI